MKNNTASPIFVHSLFRSGSTYIFNVFRQSDTDYWCYQEPFNELLLYATTEPEKLLEVDGEMQKYLRHPELDKPYFYEFYTIANAVGSVFREEFSYEQFFSSSHSSLVDLKSYFSVLINQAQGRPFFQCCRSTGRVAQIQLQCGGTHVFLWRSPWDQWWSYKKDSYFEIRNLLILNAQELPNFLRTLKIELEVPLQTNAEVLKEYDFINNCHWLGIEGSYKLFYGLWCHAKLEAEPICDLSINIDELSFSNTYHNEIIKALETLGVKGLDFSDCLMPRASYGESDGEFFLKIESYIHGLLLSHGYSHTQVSKLIQLSEARNALVVDTHVPENSNVRDAMRAREYFQKAASELTDHWDLMIDTQGKIQIQEKKVKHLGAAKDHLERELKLSERNKEKLEEHIESISVEFDTKLRESEFGKEKLEEHIESINVEFDTKLRESDYSKVKLETEVLANKEELAILYQQKQNDSIVVNQVENELNAVYASKSWRIMLYLRNIMHLMIRIGGQVKQFINKLIIYTMRGIIEQPRLKKVTLALLFKFPRIKAYFNTIALRAGLSTKNISNRSDAQQKTIQPDNLIQEELSLSSREAQIYTELKKEIEMRNQ